MNSHKITKRSFFLKILVFALFFCSACSKEVNIEIPGYEEQLIVDGFIETDCPPVVLLSKSQNVYSPTDINSFLLSLINDAEIWVSNGVDSIQLELISAANLQPEVAKILAGKLRLKLNELAALPISFYTSTNPLIYGEINKKYNLYITHNGNNYQSETSILEPTYLDDLYWKIEPETVEYGESWARLTDPSIGFDAYKWEVKRINIINGKTKDETFKPTNDPYFDDKFFNGMTFDFSYENPMGRKGDTTHLKIYKRLYKLGDSVVVKFSKMDEATFDFFEKKRRQSRSSGSPFASPINVPSNISGGALGIWAGFAPYYDTLYCVE